MQELMIKPCIYKYSSCKDFVKEFKLGKNDLVITSKRTFETFFVNLNLECQFIFHEKYGRGEPTDVVAEAIYNDIKGTPERIIAIGGGTVIDISKIFVLKDVVPVEDLVDGKIKPIKNKKLVLVPTTCGTGSEVTNIAIFTLTRKGTKKGIAVDELYADQAVLIPELLKNLPFKFFGTSSIDALIHAVESSLSPKGNEMTRLLGYKAIEIILNGYKKIAKEGEDTRFDMLEEFLIASTYAGIAFGNAGCAAVHAMSYPLGAKYHVAHGESNYAVFTGVMKNYLKIKNDGEIAKLNEYIAGILECKVENVYEELEKLLEHIVKKKPLHEYGVTEDDLKEFAKSVIENQGRLMANNFVELDEEKVYNIYKELF